MVNAPLSDQSFDGKNRALGNTTESAARENPFEAEQERLQRLESRYYLRWIWQKITGVDRCKYCGYPLPASRVRLRDNDGQSHYAGVAACGNAWACPVCSAKVRFKRGLQVTRIVISASHEGCGGAFVTWTMAHERGQELDTNLNLLTECKRWVTSQKTVVKLRKRLGYIGNISAKEIPCGMHGWHPHMHDIEIFERPLTDKELKELRQEYWRFANEFYLRHGHKGLSKLYGIMLKRAELSDEALAKYLAKLQEGEVFNLKLASEMTRADLKKGRRGSLMYVELLIDFSQAGKWQRFSQIREYEFATKGRAVLYIHKAVRKRFLSAEPDKTDEELAAEEVGGKDCIEFENWYFAQIKGECLDGKVLRAYDEGGYDKVVKMLMDYGMYIESGLHPVEAAETQETGEWATGYVQSLSDGQERAFSSISERLGAPDLRVPVPCVPVLPPVSVPAGKWSP